MTTTHHTMRFRPRTSAGRRTGGLLLLAILAAAACSGPFLKVEDALPIVTEAPTEGSHGTIDYRLAYRYRVVPGTPAAPAAFEFDGTLVPRRGLSTLTVRIHFMDGEGKVLRTEALYASGAYMGAGRAVIERRFELPPEAARFGFSDFSQERLGKP
jgi:hypothetical protein